MGRLGAKEGGREGGSDARQLPPLPAASGPVGALPETVGLISWSRLPPAVLFAAWVRAGQAVPANTPEEHLPWVPRR
jgi:hypothetical protein